MVQQIVLCTLFLIFDGALDIICEGLPTITFPKDRANMSARRFKAFFVKKGTIGWNQSGNLWNSNKECRTVMNRCEKSKNVS